MRKTALAVVVTAGLALAACGPDDEPSPAPPSSSASGSRSASPGGEGEVRRVDVPQMSFGVRLAAGQSVREPGEGETPAPSSCPPAWAVLENADVRLAQFQVFGRACEPVNGNNTSLGNGRHGVYRSADDIPAKERKDAEEVETPLGPALVFSHRYYECTQSCEDWTEPVAVIALEKPADPDFPTLVVMSQKGGLDQDALTDLIEHRLEP